MELSELKNIHKGQTIWVLGSGPSLNFLDASFFADKIVVATNFTGQALGIKPAYVFSHYHNDLSEVLPESGIGVTLAKSHITGEPFPDSDNPKIVLVEQDSYTPPGESWDPFTTHPPRADSLAYGSSSLHGSMHLAAHLGAAFIVLVGADCGTIDGEHRVAGYVPGQTPWAILNKHHKAMKDYLQDNYGVRVYSLNPFINFNLEGHTFNGA
jgi:hypothetical protein